MTRRVLLARMDNDGDVLLTGPAIRAVAASADVVLLCGPSGRQAADLLPGVNAIEEWDAPWSGYRPPPVEAGAVHDLVTRLSARALDEAIIFTSFHQSPLPLALLLRLAGVGRVTGISADYPGSLLDVRHAVDEDLHEVERALSLAAAAGYRLPDGDDGRLAVRTAPSPEPVAAVPYVVVHPGASVPARAASPHLLSATVELLAAGGHNVVVTGDPCEVELCRQVAGSHARNLGGRTSYPRLAAVLRDAAAVVVGNTGPAHLAAAVGTPVVSLFAPVVPAARWAPYGVPLVLLGDQDSPCRDSRARSCPVAGHPCLDSIRPEDIVVAVEKLIAEGLAS